MGIDRRQFIREASLALTAGSLGLAGCSRSEQAADTMATQPAAASKPDVFLWLTQSMPVRSEPLPHFDRVVEAPVEPITGKHKLCVRGESFLDVLPMAAADMVRNDCGH